MPEQWKKGKWMVPIIDANGRVAGGVIFHNERAAIGEEKRILRHEIKIIEGERRAR